MLMLVRTIIPLDIPALWDRRLCRVVRVLLVDQVVESGTPRGLKEAGSALHSLPLRFRVHVDEASWALFWSTTPVPRARAAPEDPCDSFRHGHAIPTADQSYFLLSCRCLLPQFRIQSPLHFVCNRKTAIISLSPHLDMSVSNLSDPMPSPATPVIDRQSRPLPCSLPSHDLRLFSRPLLTTSSHDLFSRPLPSKTPRPRPHPTLMPTLMACLLTLVACLTTLVAFSTSLMQCHLSRPP